MFIVAYTLIAVAIYIACTYFERAIFTKDSHETRNQYFRRVLHDKVLMSTMWPITLIWYAYTFLKKGIVVIDALIPRKK